MKANTKTKKHPGRKDLLGEHKFGDLGQLILLFLFMVIWIGDSFIFRFSTFLDSSIPQYVQIIASSLILLTALYLAIVGIKIIFIKVRDEPTLLKEGIFSWIRHPLYTSALLLYLGFIILSMSLLSAGFWLIIICFYYYISKYEERILSQYFGDEYIEYKKQVGMWFPKIRIWKTNTGY